jgi:hypothetical protein
MGICETNATIEATHVNQRRRGRAAAGSDVPLSPRHGKLVQYRAMTIGPNRTPDHE